jgi:hypothetical protein
MSEEISRDLSGVRGWLTRFLGFRRRCSKSDRFQRLFQAWNRRQRRAKAFYCHTRSRNHIRCLEKKLQYGEHIQKKTNILFSIELDVAAKDLEFGCGAIEKLALEGLS